MKTSVYFNSGGNPSLQNGIYVITQSGNGSWSPPTPITINGSFDPEAADTNIAILSNGTYLLAYSTSTAATGGIPAPGVAIHTATSTDGVNFTNPQPAFTLASNLEVSDPAIVQLANGSFLMSASNFGQGGVSFYTSQDGRNYSSTGVSLPGDLAPSLLLLSNGDVRLYETGANGIVSYLSTNNGQTWTQEPGLRLAEPVNELGGLVSVVQSGPSQWLMVLQELTNVNGPTTVNNDQLVLATSTDGLNFTVTQTGFQQAAGSPDVIVTPPVTNVITPGITPGQQIELIYIAYFNRAADGAGFAYWMTQSATLPLTSIANAFAPQAETIALYPFLGTPTLNLSTPTAQSGLTTFINSVYENMFGHAADSAGGAYWVGQITNGAVGLGAAALAIANGATGTDATELQNKITVAMDFTARTQSAGLGLTNISPLYLTDAHTVLNGVDGTSLNDASVTAGENATTAFISGTQKSSTAGAEMPSPTTSPITIAVSNSTIDPGAGSSVIQFLSGARADALVLHANSLDVVSGFDLGTDTLDLRSLLTESNVNLNGDVLALSNYLSITDQGGDAFVNFSPTGQSGGGTIAVLRGLGGAVACLDSLIARNAVQIA